MSQNTAYGKTCLCVYANATQSTLTSDDRSFGLTFGNCYCNLRGANVGTILVLCILVYVRLLFCCNENLKVNRLAKL